MKNILTALWTSALLLTTGHAHANISDDIDRIMVPYADQRNPGAAVLLLRDDQILHAKGYGTIDLESTSPTTQNSSFRLASLTKQFIAFGIAMLAENGDLDINQSIPDFIPEFPGYGRKISVAHLVHHQSGLVDYEGLIPQNQTEQISDQDVLNLYIRKTKSTRFSPGTQYSYSNGGYVLLGLIIERVAQMSLGSFLKQNIFEVLQMNSVMYQGELSPIMERAFGYSLIAKRWRKTDQSVTSATRGDGGIYASVSDLVRWTKSLSLNSPSRLVSNETLTQIFSAARLKNGAKTQYGYGWVIDRYQGKRRYSHTGSSIGFRTAIQIFPDVNTTIVILTNRNSGQPWTLAEKIFDLL